MTLLLLVFFKRCAVYKHDWVLFLSCEYYLTRAHERIGNNNNTIPLAIRSYYLSDPPRTQSRTQRMHVFGDEKVLQYTSIYIRWKENFIYYKYTKY